MAENIKTVTLALPFRLGSVNCYLVQDAAGSFLIDTGSSNQRAALDRELDAAGCQPGSLKLIVLTHGDFDHAANAAYLREKFRAPVAMHKDDFGMVERGDMFWNRTKGNGLIKSLAPLLFGFSRSDRFTPDMALADGLDLSPHGFEATVVTLPGHSKGSIGILTPGGILFCGDLLENVKRPAVGSIMDDTAVAAASVEKLKGLGITTVYPGHGQAFEFDALLSRVSGSST